ncbi:MAG: Unknown protein [uncultured Thiotrichaceae bacterium]|uniref:DUF2189 domain-containing protein n=1 Tax=uncultured Thiotrichaceae bacterium TaxID=298394 RepID=A0A6S6SRR4_9GAMM|nr:MAG: Unknown protein [uncultured Thiotrichaceae bacterium]
MQDYLSKPEHASAPPRAEDLFKSYQVNSVEVSAIKGWLKAGWEDIKVNPAASLAYGAIFALVGIVLSIISASNPAFFVSTATGFLLVGPFLALGLYELSRRIEQGEPVKFMSSVVAMERNTIGLALYAVGLSLLMVFWVRMAAVVTGIFFNSTTLAQEGYAGLITGLLSMEQGWIFTLLFMVVGLLFALVAFVVSVVSVPMLLDRKADIVTAATTSVRAVLKSPLTMLCWAATITAVIGLGILTFDIGLIVAMPLIAHASWHVYRDVVVHAEDDPEAVAPVD